MSVEVVCPDDYMGDVIGNLSENAARLKAPNKEEMPEL